MTDRSWLTRNVRVLSAVSFLQDAASELLYPLLPIYLTAVLGAPPSVVGAIEGVAEGAASVTKLAVGPLGDRFGRKKMLLLCAVLFAGSGIGSALPLISSPKPAEW